MNGSPGIAARRSRGTVMFAVLFLVVIASLSAASMLTATAAERRAAVRSVEDLELRLAMRSALTVVTADLARQRTGMLMGETPSTPDAVRLDRGEPDSDAPPSGLTVEFVPFADGRTLIPEAGRLDLNAAPIEALASLPGLPEGLASVIETRRRAEPFRSPVELISLLNDPERSGTASLDDPFAGAVLGESPAIMPEDDPGMRSSVRDLTDGGGRGGNGPRSAIDASDDDKGDGGRWLDLLTVYAADPTLSAGIADPERTGAPRVNINAPWSDRLERSLAEAAGDAVDDSVRTLFVDAPRLSSPGVLVGLLSGSGVPAERWGALLDAVTTTADPYRLGLVDLNHAPAGVLATLPGLGAEEAEAIVAARDRLDLAERRSVEWPMTQGIIDETQFRACVDFVSVRSLQWRFMLRASFEPETDDFLGFDPDDAMPELLPEADEFGVALEGDPEEDTGPSLLFEVVLDLAGDRPRIAYLRERTAYDLAIAVAAIPGMNPNTRDGVTDAGSGDGPQAAMPAEFGSGLTPASLDAASSPGSAGTDTGSISDPFASADDAGDFPGLGSLGDPGDEMDDQRVSSPAGRDSSTSRRGRGGGSAAGTNDAGRDNRIGRWAPRREGRDGGRR